MSYWKMKQRNERRDEITRLDAVIQQLRARIKQLEDAIIVHAPGQSWAHDVLDQETR
jgi:hypothetical protein